MMSKGDMEHMRSHWKAERDALLAVARSAKSCLACSVGQYAPEYRNEMVSRLANVSKAVDALSPELKAEIEKNG